MKTDKFGKIETFKDIEIEKEKLQYKISLAEERINNHFNSLTRKLTFENLAAKIEDTVLAKSIRIFKIFKWAYNLFTPKKED